MDERLDELLGRVMTQLTSAAPHLASDRRVAAERWNADAAALRFHLADSRRSRDDLPRLVAILGGTGTGKSTLVNRLLGRPVTATSFRRTYTTGPVAVADKAAVVPAGWLGLEQVVVPAESLPARGQIGALMVVELAKADTDSNAPSPDLQNVIIDTPDLDGDQPAHHAQADRVFRWSHAIVFLVTPEKYQMTELLPYYRLAKRYGVPALYVMNKCEEQAAADDYRQQLIENLAATEPAPTPRPDHPTSPPTTPRLATSPHLFAVPRDDASYNAPPEMNLEALRSAIRAMPGATPENREKGLQFRSRDVLGRLTDQVIAPLKEDRRDADRMIAALRSMESPSSQIDVNPLTQQLQRRLQQRSILYLMGPQRILDRVRQAPTLLARLPRVAWDYLRRGEISPELLNPGNANNPSQVPDFSAILKDQFAVVQSRIDDALRSTATGARWIDDTARPYASVRIDPAQAGKIAEEELAELRSWLEKKWNATPRDTRMIEMLLKYLPGGRKLARWTEAAPYLLTVVLVTHGVFLGHLDLMILGGYGLATWLTERISNEVTARTRATNVRIEQRFLALARDQIRQACEWLNQQAPSRKLIEQLERAEEEMGQILDG